MARESPRALRGQTIRRHVDPNPCQEPPSQKKRHELAFEDAARFARIGIHDRHRLVRAKGNELQAMRGAIVLSLVEACDRRNGRSTDTPEVAAAIGVAVGEVPSPKCAVEYCTLPSWSANGGTRRASADVCTQLCTQRSARNVCTVVSTAVPAGPSRALRRRRSTGACLSVSPRRGPAVVVNGAGASTTPVAGRSPVRDFLTAARLSSDDRARESWPR